MLSHLIHTKLLFIHKDIIIIASTSKPQKGEKDSLRLLETIVLQSIEGIALRFK